MGNATNSTPTYPACPNRCYEYPKHALSRLDAAPTADEHVFGVREDEVKVNDDTGESYIKEGDKGIPYKVTVEQNRLLRPRTLMVYRDNDWKPVNEKHEPYDGVYIFISFATASFEELPKPTDEIPAPKVKKLNKAYLNARARSLAKTLGVQAYWIDCDCRSEEQPELTDDVHRFCDVIRGPRQVCGMLPDRLPISLVSFGGKALVSSRDPSFSQS
jgi:hypothetical protein